MTRSHWTTILLTLALVAGPAAFAANTPSKSGAQRRVASTAINNFRRIDEHGAPFALENLLGRVVVVAFVYTSCPDVCPLITASLRQVQVGLSADERQRVHLLTITTD